jgi:hypothetical protein
MIAARLHYRSSRLTLLGLHAILGCQFLYCQTGCQAQNPPAQPSELGKNAPLLIHSEELDESSGLGTSRLQDKYFWTHNDSGDSPRLFHFSLDTLKPQELHVVGAKAIDWEDMAAANIDDKPTLIIGDIGDNGARRDSVQLYLLDEPTQPVSSVTVRQIIDVRYPDGPIDCEALAYDSDQRRILLVGKTRLPLAPVYAIPLPPYRELQPAAMQQVVAERIATLPIPMVTAMDIRRDNRQLAITGYRDLFLFDRQQDETWEIALSKTPSHNALPPLRQIEAIAYDVHNRLWITSEANQMPLQQVIIDSD